MTQGSKEGLFRREALEHKATAAVAGGVLRVAPRWTSVAFYALVAVFILVLIAASVIEIPRYVQGTTAAGSDGRTVLLVPAAEASRLSRGEPVEIDGQALTVVEKGPQVEPEEARMSFGALVSGPTVPVVLTGSRRLQAGTAVKVLVDREAVLISLIPGLRSLIGAGDG